MSPAAAPQLDAIVLGAGWAGLQCALQLSRAGKRVLCLEARKRLGGRAFTHTWDDDTPMDNNERQAGGSKGTEGGSRTYSVDFGCSYIHGYNEGNPVKQIAERYGVRVHIPRRTNVSVIGPDGAQLDEKLAQRLLANLGDAQEHAKKQGRQRREQMSSSSTAASETSLASLLFADESALFSGLSSAQERDMAKVLARSLHVPLGTSLEEVAADYFGSEASFGGTDAMPEGGFSLLIDKLAEDLRSSGGQIRLGEIVSRVVDSQKQGQGVHVTARNEQGQDVSYDAKTAVVTFPLAVLKKNTHFFEPSLDDERQKAIAKTSVGNLNKVLLAYNEPWWDQQTGTFHVLPSKQPSAEARSSLEDLYASCSLIVSSLCAPSGLPDFMTAPALLVMVGGPHAKHLEQYDRLHAAEALHAYLEPRLRCAEQSAPSLKHAFYSRWARQAQTGGATTTPVTLGNSRNDFSVLGRSAWNGQLLFAGEHCQPDHRGSIAGAVVSADDAAQGVLRHLQAARY